MYKKEVKKPKRKITFVDLFNEEVEKETKRRETLKSPVATVQAKFAEITGTKFISIFNWRNGAFAPMRLKIKAIAEHFDVDPDSLFPNNDL